MIDQTTYKNYSDLLSSIYDTINDSQTDMSYVISFGQMYSPLSVSANISKSYMDNYQVLVDNNTTTLQSFVQNKSNMTINNWITSQGIKVKETFANASTRLGYPISKGNIE
jgi:hypothetical protein